MFIELLSLQMEKPLSILRGRRKPLDSAFPHRINVVMLTKWIARFLGCLLLIGSAQATLVPSDLAANTAIPVTLCDASATSYNAPHYFHFYTTNLPSGQNITIAGTTTIIVAGARQGGMCQ